MELGEGAGIAAAAATSKGFVDRTTTTTLLRWTDELFDRRSQFHQVRLVENARIDNPNFANATQGLMQHYTNSGVGRHEALATAYARIYRSLQAQAASLANIDDFLGYVMNAGEVVEMLKRK